ncbi:helix-turn-helix domain-containing protein [Pseudotabrizicola sp. L79]|uniref:helix-turn-helix domain-containing protein n=1 Tax=Pseudotabrizicola sp. L79 TaxID=3118402 RepID=UPI002F92E4EA
MAETDDWYSGDVATFGDRLAGAREAAGLTQDQLAKRLGVRVTSIRAWEDDSSEPRANRLQMMAGMLNVSLRWLLTGEGDGLDAPATAGLLSDDAQTALKDLGRMRAQLLALATEMGQMEKRLRHLLRDEE